MKFSIADFVFDISPLATVPPSMLPFRCADDAKTDFTISLTTQSIEIQGYKPLQEYEWFEAMCTLYQTPESCDFVWQRVNTKSAQVESLRWHGDNPTHFDLHSSARSWVLEHFVLIAFTYATLPLRTLVLHSAVVENGGKGFMFLGESGTGKSTHTRLWVEHVAGSVMLNDDAPVVRMMGGKPVVYGSPWSGKGRVFRNEHRELHGLCRLSQAPANKIETLRKSSAFAAVLPSCMPSLMMCERHVDMVFETLSELIETTKQYHLECLPNQEAATLCHKIMNDD